MSNLNIVLEKSSECNNSKTLQTKFRFGEREGDRLALGGRVKITQVALSVLPGQWTLPPPPKMYPREWKDIDSGRVWRDRMTKSIQHTFSCLSISLHIHFKVFGSFNSRY